jgi:hypothetical protein
MCVHHLNLFVFGNCQDILLIRFSYLKEIPQRRVERYQITIPVNNRFPFSMTFLEVCSIPFDISFSFIWTDTFVSANRPCAHTTFMAWLQTRFALHPGGIVTFFSPSSIIDLPSHVAWKPPIFSKDRVKFNFGMTIGSDQIRCQKEAEPFVIDQMGILHPWNMRCPKRNETR